MTISPSAAGGDPLDVDDLDDRDGPLETGWSYDLVPPSLLDDDEVDDELDDDEYELWSRD